MNTYLNCKWQHGWPNQLVGRLELSLWVILLLWCCLKGDSAFRPQELLGLIAVGCILKMDKQEKGKKTSGIESKVIRDFNRKENVNTQWKHNSDQLQNGVITNICQHFSAGVICYQLVISTICSVPQIQSRRMLTLITFSLVENARLLRMDC